MRFIILLVLVLAGCKTPGALDAPCKEDGTCMGNLVCRETIDFHIRVGPLRQHTCVLPTAPGE